MNFKIIETELKTKLFKNINKNENYNGLNKIHLSDEVINTLSKVNEYYAKTHPDFAAFKNKFMKPFLANLLKQPTLEDKTDLPSIKKIFNHVIAGLDWVKQNEIVLWFDKVNEIVKANTLSDAETQIRSLCDDLAYLDAMGYPKISLKEFDQLAKIVGRLNDNWTVQEIQDDLLN